MAAISETKRRRTFNFHCIYIGFVRRIFQKRYWDMYHTTLSDIVKPFYKMAAISEVIRLSQKLRGAEPSMLALYIYVLWSVDSRKSFVEYIMPMYPPFWRPWRPFLT